MAESSQSGWKTLRENTVGKEEIARYKQFLLFPQCLQKTPKNKGLFGKGLMKSNVPHCLNQN